MSVAKKLSSNCAFISEKKNNTNVCSCLCCFDISSYSNCLLRRVAWAATAQSSYKKRHIPAEITFTSQRSISNSNTNGGFLSIAVGYTTYVWAWEGCPPPKTSHGMQVGTDEFHLKINSAATCWQCDSSSSSSCWDTDQVGCDQWCVPSCGEKDY